MAGSIFDQGEEAFHIDQPETEQEQLGHVLQQISGQLRLSLGNIHSAMSRLAPPDRRDQDGKLDMDAAVLCQSYYRILRLTNNLADAFRQEQAPGMWQENGDIVKLCRSVIDRAEPLAQMLDIQLTFRCARQSHIISMNSGGLERLLLNLLSNAFKFIRKDERRVSLTVRVEGEQVLLVLTDTGCGMTPEELAIAFDRCRLTRQLDPPPHGLGLGLSICQRIAHEHGGSVMLTSDAGKGTTATVSLANKRAPLRLKTALPCLDPTGGFNTVIMELSDMLPKQAFMQKYLD